MATTPRVTVAPSTRSGMFALAPGLGARFADLALAVSDGTYRVARILPEPSA